jgi:plasmid stabilization system protein ParE
MTEYALRMIDRLTKRSVQIARFPYSGRMVLEYELNEIREVLEWPYRIIYLINPEQSHVEVLAVVHGARSHPEISDNPVDS